MSNEEKLQMSFIHNTQCNELCSESCAIQPGIGSPLMDHVTVAGGCPSVRHSSCIASSSAVTMLLGGTLSRQRGGSMT